MGQRRKSAIHKKIYKYKSEKALTLINNPKHAN